MPVVARRRRRLRRSEQAPKIVVVELDELAGGLAPEELAERCRALQHHGRPDANEGARALRVRTPIVGESLVHRAQADEELHGDSLAHLVALAGSRPLAVEASDLDGFGNS